MSLIATTQVEAAETIGVDRGTFRRWIKEGCPGRKQRYVIRDIIDWARENKWNEEGSLIEGATGEATDPKTQWVLAKLEKTKREVALADFKIGVQEDQLVEVERVQELLARASHVVRSSLEMLERKHGRDALDMVLEAWEEVENLDFSSATT